MSDERAVEVVYRTLTRVAAQGESAAYWQGVAEAVVADLRGQAVADRDEAYARLVVDGNDIDRERYLNDPIYHGIVHRIHRGTSRQALDGSAE
jgi:hypothetical protein